MLSNVTFFVDLVNSEKISLLLSFLFIHSNHNNEAVLTFYYNVYIDLTLLLDLAGKKPNTYSRWKLKTIQNRTLMTIKKLT